ncbi:MAG: hypothetical protein IT462_09660 [Planctomycetes bacterium]|nr:hypothetical protein [Planctomycetota bacterium]
MRTIRLLLPLSLLAFALSGCLDFAETTGVSVGMGSPEGDDGYALDYKAPPADVWEVFRIVARNNGEITREDPEKMELEGKRINRAEGERTPDVIRGKVYTVAGTGAKARLIVHVREPNSVDSPGQPETARSYCFAVMRELERRKGGKVEKDPSVVVGSEPAVGVDEAVGYFIVTREQAFNAALNVVTENGEVSVQDLKAGIINGVRKSKLEPVGDVVNVYLYDRTEQDNVRTKVSVRVRTKQDDKPRQDIAKAYIKAMREALEKAVGKKVDN